MPNMTRKARAVKHAAAKQHSDPYKDLAQRLAERRRQLDAEDARADGWGMMQEAIKRIAVGERSEAEAALEAAADRLAAKKRARKPAAKRPRKAKVRAVDLSNVIPFPNHRGALTTHEDRKAFDRCVQYAVKNSPKASLIKQMDDAWVLFDTSRDLGDIIRARRDYA